MYSKTNYSIQPKSLSKRRAKQIMNLYSVCIVHHISMNLGWTDYKRFALGSGVESDDQSSEVDLLPDRFQCHRSGSNWGQLLFGIMSCHLICAIWRRHHRWNWWSLRLCHLLGWLGHISVYLMSHDCSMTSVFFKLIVSRNLWAAFANWSKSQVSELSLDCELQVQSLANSNSCITELWNGLVVCIGWRHFRLSGAEAKRLRHNPWRPPGA